MKIVVTSVLVDDQEKAQRFYCDVVGFQLKTNIPLGEHHWLTVVATSDPDGVQLVLEPRCPPGRRAVGDHSGLRRHVREPDPDRAPLANSRHFAPRSFEVPASSNDPF